MKKVVQFGAGNIGRAFMGQLFFEAGFRTTFVDVRNELIDLINKEKEYTLRIVAEKSMEVLIKNIQAVNSGDCESVVSEVAGADLLCTAVGANSIKYIAPLVARGFQKRMDSGNPGPIDMLICENLMNVRTVFKDMVLQYIDEKYHSDFEKKFGFVEAVVGRMVPAVPQDLLKKDPLLVFAEAYKELPVDKPAFKAQIPEIPGMMPIDDFPAYEARKLYTHNAGHAILAYLGYKKGYTYIHESIKDKEIKKILLGAIIDESGRAMIKKYNFRAEDYQAHVNDLVRRFANAGLCDTLVRVAKDPIRKLKPHDRFIGAARIAVEYGIKPKNLVSGIRAALSYDNFEDKEARELQGLLKDKGLDWVLTGICGLSPDEELYQLIKECF